MNQQSQERQQQLREEFLSLKTPYALCGLLQTDMRRLKLQLQQPKYKAFTVPKKDGGQRQIEAPGPGIKRLQTRLNRYLRAVYYFEKSHAAYGFVLNVRNDADRRNVLTNARKHLGRPYLLNIDLKDFFHQVKQKRVKQLFGSTPFSFERDIPNLLTRLVTFKGRLPMGAPSSPVVSNLACLKLDEMLSRWCEQRGWVYTRYADDLSFSHEQAIGLADLLALKKIIQNAHFKVNEDKIKLYGPDEDKVVTGLILREKVELAAGYLTNLSEEIGRLASVFQAQNRQGELHTRWADKLKQQVFGRINFAGFVMGRRNQQYIDLKNQYYAAVNPPEEEFGAMSWWGFPYNF
ncbi:MAG: reverse transcriptase family protein [Bacteroidota bacterium]